MSDSFAILSQMRVDEQSFSYFSLDKFNASQHIEHLPYSLKIVLENLLRHEDNLTVTREAIDAVAKWSPALSSQDEIAFMPSRVILQDFTGVPCVVDLAAMRDAMVALGGDPKAINPLVPVELVIDHSIQVDVFGRRQAIELNGQLEFRRNIERYSFLRWGQKALANFEVVPPNTGIVHQVNLEYLAKVVMTREKDGTVLAFPDTVFGTDSHTTMINGLGVLGWGVGGIEAEAAMLGQPSSMLVPQVVGFGLYGRLPEGSTATDLVLTVTQMLRQHGVVGKFVEFFGDGLDELPLADRATIANMAPEYGATCGIFPVDQEVLRYLRLSGRDEKHIRLVEAYCKAQGLWRYPNATPAKYSSTLRLDLSEVQASLAGPSRPQDRVLLSALRANYQTTLQGFQATRKAPKEGVERFYNEGGDTAVDHPALGPQHYVAKVQINQQDVTIGDGAVVIAAITSCTNTSNPAVMIGAGLLAKKAVAKGLHSKPWVKTSLAPGSLVVTKYLEKAGLLTELEALGFYLVGYGCTTCIGNSGPLPEPVSAAINGSDLVVASVLSGNRNFDGRIHPEVKMNYLTSPPLVVAFALAGTIDIDLTNDPLGSDPQGNPVFLRDIWPSNHEVAQAMSFAISPELFKETYSQIFVGDERWHAISTPEGELYRWDPASTYLKHPPYFDGMTLDVPAVLQDIHGARVLGLFGDSITTDHISPAGNIKATSPAGQFLQSRGVEPIDFNSYGSRRGNDDVMVRGTFANIRIKNLMLGGEEGGYTLYGDLREKVSIYEAAMKYKEVGIPLIVIAGKEYGTGSSRDWAAKGANLLGIKAVLAESFERIHRSNLVGMGVLPIAFRGGQNAQSLGLDGSETFDITGLEHGKNAVVTIEARRRGHDPVRFQADVLLLTPKEVEYFRHGGILHYVLRQLAKKTAKNPLTSKS